MRKDIKIVFMGTPEFAKSSFVSLVESGYNIVGCFTNPDKPSGRGMKLQMSPVKEYALDKSITVYQPIKVRNNPEVLEILKELSPDIIVVVAYGKILPKEILEFPRLGCVNVHGSLLPKYRGAAPIQWSVINGEKTTGVTTMFMDEGMDTGDMLLKQEIDILQDDNLEKVYNKLKDIGAELIVETLDKIADGSIERIKQSDDFTLAPMISKEMTKIDFLNKTAKEVYNFVRGLCPSPATYMELEDGRKYKVFYCKEIEDSFSEFSPGEICSITKDSLYIKCKENAIAILEIQPPNSKRMKIDAFVAGNKLELKDKCI